MSSGQQVEIGFSGGQVTSTRVADAALGELRTALEGGESWHAVSSEDGELLLNLSQVVFLRIAAEGQTIGFGGS